MSNELPKMLTGRAKGGPLNNVKIDAPRSWDGFVAQPKEQGSQSNAVTFHEGKYIWDWYGEASTRWKTWVWHDGYSRPKYLPPHRTNDEQQNAKRGRSIRDPLLMRHKSF